MGSLHDRASHRATLAERVCRGAAADGSRAFQRPVSPIKGRVRRVAAVERAGLDQDATKSNMTSRLRAVDFKRRSATRGLGRCPNRGLKPTATIMESLRDRTDAQGACRGAAFAGSRAFQRPDRQPKDNARRVAAVERDELEKDTTKLAKTIHQNFEEVVG
jgi:hypothetical protein